LLIITSIEIAEIMWKLAHGKKNWGGVYDRLEHFKKFPNLKEALKELKKKGWILFHHKSYDAISLNTKYKKEIVAFIEKQMPYIQGVTK
jgi:hypothetical protein